MRTALLSLLPLLACAESSSDCEEPSDLEQATAELINDHRAGLGLVELQLDACISEIARDHSQDMAAGRVGFGHDGFEQRWEEILVLDPTAMSAGENVAMSQGYADPDIVAFQGWLDSDSHRENIELPAFDTTGMGVSVDEQGGTWFTQLFVGH